MCPTRSSLKSVTRLRPFLNDLIGPFQGSFILGRGIIDSDILAQ